MTKKELNALADLIAERVYERVMEKLSQQAQQKSETPLNIRQAAEYLGVAVQTIYNNIDSIPHTKKRNRLVFTQESLQEYLLKSTD